MRPLTLFAALLLLTVNLLGQDATQALKRVLNSKGFILKSPAEDYPYPGGFLVTNGDRTTFHFLPDSYTKPTPMSGQADFPAISKTKHFTLGALLSSIASLIGVSPGVDLGHNSSLKFSEVKGDTSLITDSQMKDIMGNSDVKDGIAQFFATKGQRVFLIREVVKTKKLSVSTSSSFSGDITVNGKKPKECTDDSKPGGKQDDSQKPSSNSNIARSPAITRGGRGGPYSLLSSADHWEDQGPASQAAGTPGGSLQLCKNGSSTLSMEADSALVFAMGAFEVIDHGKGLYTLTGVYATPKSGVVNLLAGSGKGEQWPPQVEKAAAVNPAWTKPQPWPAVQGPTGKQ